MSKLFIFSILFMGLVSFKPHEKIGWELTPGIYILDKQAPIKSLDELTNILKGKQIFVDRWATWCSPCVDEFKYKDTLNQFLNSKGIVLVYLNSDKDIDESKWYEFIKSHDLKGYHLRLNDDLKADLVKHKIFFPMIPQYMIINKEGFVVENRALRPSDGEKLYAQLDSLLNN
ncbi:MAG TPA: thioredoxin-like domain-containing protein [Williamwhitmania sp.]|nr:thioredoxin-like domain-containing protein [Williamwhitmania sp.]